VRQSEFGLGCVNKHCDEMLSVFDGIMGEQTIAAFGEEIAGIASAKQAHWGWHFCDSCMLSYLEAWMTAEKERKISQMTGWRCSVRDL